MLSSLVESCGTTLSYTLRMVVYIQGCHDSRRAVRDFDEVLRKLFLALVRALKVTSLAS